jgi:hypothetical protein
MSIAGQFFDVQRLRVLTVDPVAYPAKTREVAQALLLACMGHRRDSIG